VQGVPVLRTWQAIFSRVRAMAMIAFLTAPLLRAPPNRRTSRLNLACRRPGTRIAAQAAWTSSGLMQFPPSPVRPPLLFLALR
jgi:hypothetical protein